MNRNHFWKLAVIVIVVLWTVYEMYPPTARDLIDQFENSAQNRDDQTFRHIVEQARTASQGKLDLEYNSLQTAIGTNDIRRFFVYDAKTEAHPTTYILNRLQREAAGKIKLGIDLP